MIISEQVSSGFTGLPAEIRYQVYRYLIPLHHLDVDLCTPRRADPHFLAGGRRQSIISSLVSQTLELDKITRGHGLHLLLVNKSIRGEILPLLSQLTVRFHCHRCFEELLRNLSYGMGVGVKWMKHVEIHVDVPGFFQGRRLTPPLARFMVTEATQQVQNAARMYYGRMDLAEREKWKAEPVLSDEDRAILAARRGGGGDAAGGQAPELPSETVVGAAAPRNLVIHWPGDSLRHLEIPREWIISGWFDV